MIRALRALSWIIVAVDVVLIVKLWVLIEGIR